VNTFLSTTWSLLCRLFSRRPLASPQSEHAVYPHAYRPPLADRDRVGMVAIDMQGRLHMSTWVEGCCQHSMVECAARAAMAGLEKFIVVRGYRSAGQFYRYQYFRNN